MSARSLDTTRRGFLKTGSGLVFLIGAGGITDIALAQEVQTDPASLAGWVWIEPNGAIHIAFPVTEMGQGSSTALPLILAEELDANWDDVVVEQVHRDDRRFGNPLFGNVLYTAGSTGVSGYFGVMRQAGADARRVLLRTAAARWQVPVDELQTEPSVVVHDATGRRATYGDLVVAAGALAQGQTPAVLKSPDAFRLIGRDIPRLDIPAKSSGTETYAIDVRVPDMAYATVLRAPVEGETVQSVDEGAARETPGLIDIVALPDGLAVVAETQWAAALARNALDVTWTETAEARGWNDTDTLASYQTQAEDLTSDAATWRESGNVTAAVEGAETVVIATYLSDYAYHAQIEPMAVVADVKADRAEVWAGTQTQSWTMRTITEELGLSAGQVTLHMMTMGGGFGRRTALQQEYVRDALLASRAVGRPVKVIWTREDDVKHGWFRPAAAQHLRAGLAADGRLQGWQHRVATPSVIAYFNPLRWSQVEPNDIISMRGSESQFYDIPDFLAEHVITERQARVIPWRGIGASYTSFAAECFMDEVAGAAGRDPFDFRYDLVAHNPRGRALLDRVRAMSNWDRPPEGRGLGLSFAGYGNSMAAGVAEISLDRQSGSISVHRFYAAVDAGLVVAPDNSVNQIEGGIIFGISSALHERITITGGQVNQENFYDYEVLRADQAPEIMVELARNTEPPSGIGEAGTPMVAAAIANAFHALTGARLRHMPFTPDRVRAALA
ncbi:MAG: molybdopterin cofactor-binding domain-containing protein [Pseudomonadota bacterium]